MSGFNPLADQSDEKSIFKVQSNRLKEYFPHHLFEYHTKTKKIYFIQNTTIKPNQAELINEGATDANAARFSIASFTMGFFFGKQSNPPA